MLDKQNVIHDLALVYAQEKFREYISDTPKPGRSYPSDVSKLASLYEAAAVCLANQADGLLNAYLDDSGNQIISD